MVNLRGGFSQRVAGRDRRHGGPRLLERAGDDAGMPIESQPLGRFSAETVAARSPLAGTRNRNGRPGVAPVIVGAWMAGRGEFSWAIGGPTGQGGSMVSGRALAPGASSRMAPAQSARS